MTPGSFSALGVPALIEILAPPGQVSPLLTATWQKLVLDILSRLQNNHSAKAATADAETRSAIMSVWAKLFRCRFLGVGGRHVLRQFLQRSVKLASFAEGPMDRCGLAFFLCNKFTNVCVLLTATETWQELFQFYLSLVILTQAGCMLKGCEHI